MRPLVILMLLAALAACGPQHRDTEPRERRQAALTPEDPVAVRVNGEAIRHSDVLREAAAQGAQDYDEALLPGSPTYERILEELVDQRLLAQEARRRDLQDTPEARRRLALAEERILGNILVETALAEAVTEEAILRVYEEQSRLSRGGEEVRARHILVDTLEEAQEVKRLLDAGGDFAELARRVSQDYATRGSGGDLGYFRRDSIVSAFGDVAFATAPGVVSEPFETEFGWHVLRVEHRRRETPPTLEQMRPNIVRFLTFDQIQSLVDGLRDGAEIQRLLAPEPPQDGAIPPGTDDGGGEDPDQDALHEDHDEDEDEVEGEDESEDRR